MGDNQELFRIKWAHWGLKLLMELKIHPTLDATKSIRLNKPDKMLPVHSFFSKNHEGIYFLNLSKLHKAMKI